MMEISQRKISRDTLFDGSLSCLQYQQGYRFSVDAVLLSHFPQIRKGERILDLGSGSGIIGLILLYRHQDQSISVTGYEKQQDLADLARRNIADNGLDDRFSLVTADLADIRCKLAAETFSLILANPPFYDEGRGRRSLNAEAMAARHRCPGGLELFVEAAFWSVENRGRVVFIYPADLVAELISAFKEKKIEPKRLQMVYSYPQSDAGAKLVLLEGVKNGGTGCTVLAPCYMYQHKNGPYSEMMQSMYSG